MSGIGKRVSGSWVSGDYGIIKTATDTIANLPAVLYPTGATATVGLKGQTVQSGTPSPQNPVMPNGTGERTGNLFDISNPNIYKGFYNTTTNSLAGNANNAFIYIPLVQGRKYYVSGCKRYNTSASVRWVTTSSTPSYTAPCIRTGLFAQTDIFTITAETNENYLALFLCGDSDYSAYGTVEDAIATNGANLVIDNGIKIPFSSAGQTTPIYLGEVQTTRLVKKLVLTGEENVTSSHTDIGLYTIPITDYLKNVGVVTNICSHYKAGINVSGWSEVTDKTSRFYGNTSSSSKLLYIRDSSYTSIAGFKSYLATQYANGTPVTVWYVLATEETGAVNEPLMKIGAYADEVSNVSIPVTAGGDTLSVGTTVQPSEVTANYKGWHPAQSVHERDNGAWT